MTEELYKQELLAMVMNWSPERLDGYIYSLEERLQVTKDMLSELKAIRRKRRKAKHKETGVRSGP